MSEFYIVFALSALIALALATCLAGLLAPRTFPLPSADRRLGWVDGLRGYLALAVLAHHFFLWVLLTRFGQGWVEPSVNLINQLGAGSVGLFFMVTGLVFYPRVLAGLRGTSWVTTYVFRIFRIVPLVTVSVILVTGMIWERTGATIDLAYIAAAADWISTWTQPPPPLLGYENSGRLNAYVLWSLYYEWVFYLALLPICAGLMDVVRARALPLLTVPFALITVGLLSRIATDLVGMPIRGLLYVPLFGVGMLAYELQLRPSVRAILSARPVGFVAAAALVTGMLLEPSPYDWSLPFFGFFFVCIASGNDLFGLLRTRGALVLGECSFGIYLLHGLLLSALFEDGAALHQRLDVAELTILLPIVAAAVVPLVITTFTVVERPAMQLGKTVALLLTRGQSAPYRPNFVTVVERSGRHPKVATRHHSRLNELRATGLTKQRL